MFSLKVYYNRWMLKYPSVLIILSLHTKVLNKVKIVLFLRFSIILTKNPLSRALSIPPSSRVVFRLLLLVLFWFNMIRSLQIVVSSIWTTLPTPPIRRCCYMFLSFITFNIFFEITKSFYCNIEKPNHSVILSVYDIIINQKNKIVQLNFRPFKNSIIKKSSFSSTNKKAVHYLLFLLFEEYTGLCYVSEYNAHSFF